MGYTPLIDLPLNDAWIWPDSAPLPSAEAQGSSVCHGGAPAVRKAMAAMCAHAGPSERKCICARDTPTQELGMLTSMAPKRGCVHFRTCYFVLPALLQKLVGEFFFDYSQGNLVGILAGFLAGIFFLTHRIKAQEFRGNFGAFFERRFVAQKKSFVQSSLCRRATLILIFLR